MVISVNTSPIHFLDADPPQLLMNTEPDLNFDIDALFDHLINDLGHESADVLNWVFTFRSTDLQALADVESDLSEEFATQLQEEVEEVNEDGERSAGDPMLMVITEAALSSQEVIKLAKRMQGIATAKNLRYEGVQCFDPIDDEDLFGWLDVEEAVWRLRHFTDAGLETNGELPWAFLLLTQTPDQTRQLAAELSEMGMDDIDLYDEPNDEGDLGFASTSKERTTKPAFARCVKNSIPSPKSMADIWKGYSSSLAIN